MDCSGWVDGGVGGKVGPEVGRARADPFAPAPGLRRPRTGCPDAVVSAGIIVLFPVLFQIAVLGLRKAARAYDNENQNQKPGGQLRAISVCFWLRHPDVGTARGANRCAQQCSSRIQPRPGGDPKAAGSHVYPAESNDRTPKVDSRTTETNFGTGPGN